MNKCTIPLLLLSFLLFNSACRKKATTFVPQYRVAQLSDTITPLKFIFFDKKTNIILDSIESNDILKYEANQYIGHFDVHRIVLSERKNNILQQKKFRDTLLLNCYLKGKLFFTSTHFDMKFSDFPDKKNIKFFFNAECKGESNNSSIRGENYYHPKDWVESDSFSLKKETGCIGVSFLYLDRGYKNDSSIWESEKLKSTQYLNLLKDLKLFKKIS